MKINEFQVENWMNEYEPRCEYNMAETCVESITVDELLSLTGEREQAVQAILEARLNYGSIYGSDFLKEGICSLYRRAKPDDIVVTHGGIGANALAYLSLVNRGDRVVSILPTYQQHYSIPESIGAEVSVLRLKAENSFLPDLDELRELAVPGTRLISFCNPNNPTGAVMERNVLEKVVDIAASCGAYLLCDEAYRGLTHGAENYTDSVFDLYEKGISTASMSKTYSLAGLRLGWIAAPEDAVRELLVHRDYHVISCGVIDDYLAAQALRHRDKILERNLGIVRTNLAILDEWVGKEPGVRYVKPKGGTTALLYYDLDMPSEELCRRLQEEKGVCLLPGAAFDMEGCVRIGFCNKTEDIRQGLAKFSEFLQEQETRPEEV
jgi:aspartate/methionine/tyrosine aminotransferase